MRFHVLLSTVFAASLTTTLLALQDFAGSSAPLAFDKTTEVPGSSLKAGSYSITVPEQIADRVIVRIDSTNTKDHAIFLGVPSTPSKLQASTGLVTWQNGVTKTPALRGYIFPSGSAVEFVYPKADAAALAKNNSATVVAVDPSSEGRANLKSLTKDELKIVNLWLLSLTTTGPNNSQPAVLARHYEPSTVPASNSGIQTASNASYQRPAPAPVATTQKPVATTAMLTPAASQSQPVPQAKRVRVKTAPQVAQLDQPSTSATNQHGPAIAQLPHTAGSLPIVWLAGVLSVLGLGVLRFGNSSSRRIES